ncbi:hypothetical protein PINS_up010886 [Pythium insidiosum]|nr:hypothetical protein PINS_up010886 [Pythium insidiosum]
MTKHADVDDLERRAGLVKDKWDRGFALRSLHEYLGVVERSDAFRPLGAEFAQCLRQVDATLAPPSELLPPSSPALTDALALIEAQQAPTAAALSYWKWVALVYSTQVVEEFGTVSFFSRELLPAQLIETIKKETVTW